MNPDARVRTGPSARSLVLGATGVLGELLVTAGVVLLLFLAWQLWWTDITASSAQEKAVASLTWAPPIPTPEASAAPYDGIADPQLGDPPVLAQSKESTTFATFVVPRWGAKYQRPVSEGVSRAKTLDKLGIGHYPTSQMPGEIGNFAVAGHRVTYNKPFNRIEELKKGDALVVRTKDVWYVYAVTSTEIVTPNDVDVVAPVPGDLHGTPTKRYITLTTCHPKYSAKLRYIVHGVMQYWARTSDGIPAELVRGA